MWTKTEDLKIDWMQRADEILTENGHGPVAPEDRERYEARLQRQRLVAANYKSGVELGRKQICLETLVKCGTKFLGTPTASHLARLNRVTELDRMHELLDRVFDCNSWESWLAPVAPLIPVVPMILQRLAKICQLSPGIRFGQMMAMMGDLAEDFSDQSVWDVEDETLLTVLDQHLADLVARGGTTQPAMTSETDKAIAVRPEVPILKS